MSLQKWLSCTHRSLLWMKIHTLSLVPGTGRGGAGRVPYIRRYRGGVFTGLVREVGHVVSLQGGDAGVRLVLQAPAIATDARVGDSISVDGVCLTVVERSGETVAFDAVPETLDRTALATLEPGSRVNLEPAIRAGEPLGGHYVQGHVDGVGSVRSVQHEGDGKRLWFDLAPELLRYIVEKGSVSVQGVSLTVAAADDTGFAVALIPHTLAATNLDGLSDGSRVNVEVDVLAKYVEKLVNV
jgi:riboflavin synthase